MKEYIKMGFGFTVGVSLGSLAVNAVNYVTGKVIAKDKAFMEKLKEKDPETYEAFHKKYTSLNS